MKKSLKWTAALAAVFALTFLGGASADAAVTADQARAIAIEHAGLTEADIDHIRVKEDWDFGHVVYEIEFYSGAREYDYDISQDTGEILKYDYEVHHWRD